MKNDPDLHTYVTSKHFDITGQEISRIGKHYLISKLSRYEDLGGGPGWKSSTLLFVLHYLSRLPGMRFDHIERQVRKYFNR